VRKDRRTSTVAMDQIGIDAVKHVNEAAFTGDASGPHPPRCVGSKSLRINLTKK